MEQLDESDADSISNNIDFNNICEYKKPSKVQTTNLKETHKKIIKIKKIIK